MDIEVSFFGQLTDITQCSTLFINNPGNVEKLKVQLIEKYPGLAQSKFAIAVNNKIVQENIAISDHSKIAFMPPFSGG
jgi:sulfur-carrier protein